MKSNSILEAYSRVQPEISGTVALVELRREGDTLLLYTGAGAVRRSQLIARIAGLLLGLVGVGLLWSTIWASALIVAGALVFLIVPNTIRAARLLEIDTGGDGLVIVQSAAHSSASVPLPQIRAIRGQYDTKGWDGYSVIYAVLDDDTETPILMLAGTDEPLAEQICRTLGLLLDRPSSYAGPFGGTKTCYSPLQPG